MELSKQRKERGISKKKRGKNFYHLSEQEVKNKEKGAKEHLTSNLGRKNVENELLSA